MKKIEGEGRTRLTRFAAVTIPAAVASAGLGVCIVQGMISASLTSADAFNLQSTAITSDSLKVRPGTAEVGSGNESTIYAQTGPGTTADGVEIEAQVNVPIVSAILGHKVSLNIDSTDPTVGLPGVILNAKTLAVADKDAAVDGTTGANSAAYLQNVDLGVTQSSAGFTDTTSATGYTADGFALQAGASTLNKVDADAYAIHLSGLALDQLSITLGQGDVLP